MLSIIVAKAKNNIIGKDNKMLWKLPDDLKRFKERTTGHTIIMGRKTFESLGGILPDRMHIILSRNPDFNIDSDYVKVVHSLLELQEYMEDEEEHFVIGGAIIYYLFLLYCFLLLLLLYLTFYLHSFILLLVFYQFSLLYYNHNLLFQSLLL